MLRLIPTHVFSMTTLFTSVTSIWSIFTMASPWTTYRVAVAVFVFLASLSHPIPYHFCHGTNLIALDAVDCCRGIMGLVLLLRGTKSARKRGTCDRKQFERPVEGEEVLFWALRCLFLGCLIYSLQIPS